MPPRNKKKTKVVVTDAVKDSFKEKLGMNQDNNEEE